jgi:hypothetical protein
VTEGLSERRYRDLDALIATARTQLADPARRLRHQGPE